MAIGLLCFCLFFLIGFTGCSSGRAVMNQYQEVQYADGISAAEALIIAQHELIQSKEFKNYKLPMGTVQHDPYVRPYPNYWFVSFAAKKFDMTFWRFLVVINRQSGDVVFADPYVPLDVVDYDWVFEHN